MENTFLHLQELGLTDKEARVYVALVEIGKGTAYAIAKQARIKRPITYVVLEGLRLKGLVLKVPHSKNQIFIAKDPRELFALQEEKLQYAKRALPELLARASGKQHTTRTYLFEGRDELERALAYKRKDLAGKEMLAFYAKSDRGKVPQIYFEQAERLARQKTKIRSLAPQHHSLQKFMKFNQSPERTSIDLPESEFSAKASVEIADNFVRIFLHKDQQVLIVENKDFAEMMKEIFEMVWKTKKNL